MHTSLYFAYGSLLDHARETMLTRAGELDPGSIVPVGKAVVPDRCIATGGADGVPSLRTQVGNTAEGWLFRVTENGWQALDEGVRALSPGAGSDSTLALGPGGREIPVRLHGHPVAATAAAGSIESPVEGIFTYGTLMRGESRFATLAADGLRCVLLGNVDGRLSGYGAWPALRLGGSSDSAAVVMGEFVIPNDLGACLQRLDQLEGFKGFGHPDNLFRRTLTWVDVDQGRMRPAWVYVASARLGSGTPIASGDWREHQGTRDQFIRQLVVAHADGVADFTRQVALACTPACSRSDSRDNDLEWDELLDAVYSGQVAERRLAQVSGDWAKCPATR